MSALAEQIAREHRVARCPIHGIPDCSALLNGCSLPRRLHENALHIATVTERAVRERVAGEIEAVRIRFDNSGCVPGMDARLADAHDDGLNAAARIARGAPDA